MIRWPVWIFVLFLAFAARADDDFYVVPADEMEFEVPSEVVIIRQPEVACITTEFCGDPADDKNVRCVKVLICGEPIR